MSEQFNKYDFALDFTNPVIDFVVNKLTPGSVVLEFGPATGRLTKYMTEELGCKVYIVEIDEIAFESAIKYAYKGLCGNIETLNWEKEFLDEKFDFIIFQDVLEHLVKPINALQRVIPLLAEDGKIISSIPNITYSGVLLDMLSNKFEYRDIGIMDNTHVHFYTYETIVSLLKESNLVPIHIYPCRNSVEFSEFASAISQVPNGLSQYVVDQPWSDIYQYVFIAVKQSFFEKNTNIITQDLPDIETKLFPTRVYYDTGAGFNENEKILASLSIAKNGSISFAITNLPKVKRVRWDVVQDRCIRSFSVSLTDGKTVVTPDKASADFNWDGVDIFSTSKPQYIFQTENLQGNKIIINYSLEIDYALDNSTFFEKKVMPVYKDLIFKQEDIVREFSAKQEDIVREFSAKEENIVREFSAKEENVVREFSAKEEIYKNQISEMQKNVELHVENLTNNFNEKLHSQENTVQALNQQIVGLNSSLSIWESKEKDYYNDINLITQNCAAMVIANENKNNELVTYVEQLESECRQQAKEIEHMRSSKSWRLANYISRIYNKLKNNRIVRIIYEKTKKLPGFRKIFKKLKIGVPNAQINITSAELAKNTIYTNTDIKIVPTIEELEQTDAVSVKVSFVIPTYNAGEEFSQLLYMLKSQKGIEEIEIIIVDSGSKDETLAFANFFGVLLIEITQEEFTHSYSRNLGAKHATGDLLFFMTQDAMPSGFWWARRVIDPIITNKVVATTCMEYPREDAELYYKINIFGHAYFMDTIDKDRIGAMPEDTSDILNVRRNAQLSDVSSAIKTDVFLKYRYKGDYAEDLDLGLRLIQDGYTLGLISSEVVIHSHIRSSLYYLKRAFVETQQLKVIFSEIPTASGEEEFVISTSLKGYQQLYKITSILNHWPNQETDINVFRVQMEMHLQNLNDNLYLRELSIDDNPESELYITLLDFWGGNSNRQVLGDGMSQMFLNYFRHHLFTYLVREKTVLIKTDILEIADCFRKYYATMTGVSIAEYTFNVGNIDKIGTFAETLKGGI